MFIVNPWIFYLAEICEGLKTTVIILAIISLGYVIIRWCLWAAEEIRAFWWDKKNKNNYNYWNYSYNFWNNYSFTEYLL